MIIEELREQLAAADARKVEDELRAALNKAIGCTRWSFGDLRGRCTAIRTKDFTDYCFDNRPILRVFPPTISVEGTMLSLNRNIGRFAEPQGETLPCSGV